jgi:hypothetical protein
MIKISCFLKKNWKENCTQLGHTHIHHVLQVSTLKHDSLPTMLNLGRSFCFLGKKKKKSSSGKGRAEGDEREIRRRQRACFVGKQDGPKLNGKQGSGFRRLEETNVPWARF